MIYELRFYGEHLFQCKNICLILSIRNEMAPEMTKNWKIKINATSMVALPFYVRLLLEF